MDETRFCPACGTDTKVIEGTEGILCVQCGRTLRVAAEFAKLRSRENLLRKLKAVLKWSGITLFAAFITLGFLLEPERLARTAVKSFAGTFLLFLIPGVIIILITHGYRRLTGAKQDERPPTVSPLHDREFINAATQPVGVEERRVSRLDKPFKRVAAIFMWIGGISVFGLLLLPPVELDFEQIVHKIPTGETRLWREVRLDAQCAIKQLGGPSAMGHDLKFFLGLFHFNPYSIAMLEAYEEAEGQLSKIKSLQLSSNDVDEVKQGLSSFRENCPPSDCKNALSPEQFNSLLSACSHAFERLEPVMEKEIESKLVRVRWLMDDNFDDRRLPVSVALCVALLALLFSYCFDSTLGRLMRWIRHG